MLELVTEGGVYPVPPNRMCVLGPPPQADVPVPFGSAVVTSRADGVDIRNTGMAPFFAGATAIPPGATVFVPVGGALDIGGFAVSVRRWPRPPRLWPRRLLALLAVVGCVLALALAPDEPEPDVGQLIEARYPEVVPALRTARAAEARGDVTASANSYGVIRDAVVSRVAVRGCDREDKIVLHFLAGKSGSSDQTKEKR